MFERDQSIVVYLGGFHNKVKRELIKKINYASSALKFYHYGDIDAGGFYILNHLIKKTGIDFKPYMMNIEELKKYRNNCKALSNNDRKRLNAMLEDEDFDKYKEVIHYMLEMNIKLEQEAEN